MAKPEFLGASWFTWTYLAGIATMAATGFYSEDIKEYVDPAFPMFAGLGIFFAGMLPAVFYLGKDSVR